MTPAPATAPAANFDRLARWYRALEYLALGHTLEAARFHHLDRLATCRRILILGEGDGRCLARLLRLAPAAHVTCVDASAAMLDRAARRLSAADRARVTLEAADARFLPLPAAGYDAVLTLFFLDCFTDEEVRHLVARIAPALAPGAVWLHADFMLPAAGLARLRSRLWLAGLYAFFRQTTGISARRLPDMDAALAAAGFAVAGERVFQRGLVRSVLMNQPGSCSCSSAAR
jgi:ubiquinone/menaquinone biosynthesis C-methylase UbiE